METKYCAIWIRGQKGIFSWHTSALVQVGSRVLVTLRQKKRVGIVLAVDLKKPLFITQPILEVWNLYFIPAAYIAMAKEIALENFCFLEKVLSLIVPEKFFQKKVPAHYDIFYVLNNSDVSVVKGKKQKEFLDLITQKNGKVFSGEVSQKFSSATIKSLKEKNIIREEQGTLRTIFQDNQKKRPHFHLTEKQEKALALIQKSTNPVLLFGVTGSGKTEIYKKLSQSVLAEHPTAQVLFLLPEIALTAQLIAEFYAIFGEKIAVWHSHLSEGEKIQEWERLRNGEAQILIGTRSAVFVPLKNPKLIILDEEHEWTFKNDFAPRYWTHDVVQKIAHNFNAKLLFGTATPRVESFYECQIGNWEMVQLPDRIHDVKMPHLDIVDLKQEVKKGNFSPISERLHEEIEKILKNKKQAVLFLNKRGFSGATFCKKCGHTFECPNCSNNMKMHEKIAKQRLICHICGHLESFPSKCPACGATDFLFRGWGVQMVEKILQEQFPGIRVLRADADTVSGKYDFDALMDKFHNYEADILLGTQMITKGLDFDRVQMVGIVLADIGLSLPDFRSEERVFQLLTQVSGRAGRRTEQGDIILQTFHPDEKVFEFVQKHDTNGFLEWQIDMRKKMNFPPFSFFIKCTFSHIQKEVAFKNAKAFHEKIKLQFPDSFFAPAFFPRTHSQYHFHVLIRSNTKEARQALLEHITAFQEKMKIDINPVSLL